MLGGLDIAAYANNSISISGDDGSNFDDDLTLGYSNPGNTDNDFATAGVRLCGYPYRG